MDNTKTAALQDLLKILLPKILEDLDLDSLTNNMGMEEGIEIPKMPNIKGLSEINKNNEENEDELMDDEKPKKNGIALGITQLGISPIKKKFGKKK